MLKKLFLILTIIACFTATASAHPPSNIKLTYDPETEILHVSLIHRSSDPRSHRIRKIILYQNDEETDHFFYPKQTNGAGLEEDLYIEVESGDVVRIKAICSEAGSGEAEITIP